MVDWVGCLRLPFTKHIQYVALKSKHHIKYSLLHRQRSSLQPNGVSDHCLKKKTFWPEKRKR